MREKALKDFFEGKIGVHDFKADLEDLINRESFDIDDYYVKDLHETYEISSECLIKICDAVENGNIEPRLLEAIGFCLISSDYFTWDGDIEDGRRIAEVVSWWSAPEINYQLNTNSILKFKHFLLTGEEKFNEKD